MVKVQKKVPRGRTGEVEVWKEYTLQPRWEAARKRELLKAGYLEDEISTLDNDLESGLLSLSLRELRKVKVISGRRNHVKRYTDAEKPLSREEAIIRARLDYRKWGGIYGRLGDYIDFYYGK